MLVDHVVLLIYVFLECLDDSSIMYLYIDVYNKQIECFADNYNKAIMIKLWSVCIRINGSMIGFNGCKKNT